MHPTDAILFAATPLVPAPRFGALDPLPEGSKRFIVASKGLSVEARTAGWDLCVRLARVVTPYCALKTRIRSVAGPIPRTLLESFVERAQTEPAREVAAAITLDADGVYALIWPQVESSGAGHVRYSDAGIDDDRLVVDLHSHGNHEAYFSPMDDRSDLSRRGPYLAMVVGRCRTGAPQIEARLVLPPYLIPLTVEQLAALGVFAWARASSTFRPAGPTSPSALR